MSIVQYTKHISNTHENEKDEVEEADERPQKFKFKNKDIKKGIDKHTPTTHI